MFFASLEATLPTVHFVIGNGVRVTWPDTVVQSRLGNRDVILIKVTNESRIPAHAEMSSRGKDPSGQSRAILPARSSDQILFWDKTLVLEPSSSRYTFACRHFPAGTGVGDTGPAGPSGAIQVDIRASGIPYRPIRPPESSRSARPESHFPTPRRQRAPVPFSMGYVPPPSYSFASEMPTPMSQYRHGWR